MLNYFYGLKYMKWQRLTLLEADSSQLPLPAPATSPTWAMGLPVPADCSHHIQLAGFYTTLSTEMMVGILRESLQNHVAKVTELGQPSLAFPMPGHTVLPQNDLEETCLEITSLKYP